MKRARGTGHVLPMAGAIALLVCLAAVNLPGADRATGSRATSLVPVQGRPQVCVRYAQGTSREYMEWFEANHLRRGANAYIASDRWTNTASGGTGTPGTPITITYSYIPDGNVSVFGGVNRLHEILDAQFGSRNAWKAKFEEAFALWSDATGITFVEVSDDNAADGAVGQLGARGDVRIRAEEVDGESGVLAYAFFPDDGDITLDIDETWDDPASNYRFMISTIAHEFGHAMGLEHVGPIEGTKLMEPFSDPNLGEPKDDDIRGANHNYGDRMEPNNSRGAASNLGAFSAGQVNGPFSLHAAGDEDWYSINIAGGSLAAITARPLGDTYLIGTPFGPFSSMNTRAISPLRVEIYGANGDLLRTSDSPFSGSNVVLVPVRVPAADAQIYVRVAGVDGGGVQRYELEMPAGAKDPRKLTVEAQGADGIQIELSPADGLGHKSVTTPAEVVYSDRENVTLVAPAAAAGIQFVQWMVNGAPQSAGNRQINVTMTADITVSALFADAPIVDAGPDRRIVVGESTQLLGSATGGMPPYTYNWTPADRLIGATTLSPMASPTASTDYTLTVTDANGTQVIDMVRVEVLPPLRANAGANQFTVKNGSFTLTGSAMGGEPPYSYSWSPAGLLSNASTATVRGSVAETTDFTLTVTDADGRKHSRVAKVIVVDGVQVDAGADVVVRPNQSTQLTANILGGLPPYDVSWEPAFLLTEVTTRSVLAKPSEKTTFEVFVRDSLGQESRDTVTVDLASPLTVTARAGSETVLRGDSTTLTGSVSGGVPPYQYEWGPKEEMTNADSAAATLTPSVTRTYGLNVRDSLGQTGAASVRVAVVKSASASAGGDSALDAPGVTDGSTAPPPFCGTGLFVVMPAVGLSLLAAKRRLA